jgi:phage-related protein
MGVNPEKPIVWMVDSRQVLSGFPEDARGEIGHSLRIAQRGEKATSAKPLFSGVMEIVADSNTGNTYRAAYVAKLEDHIYVLHCFEKKSKRGIATPKPDQDMIRRRLKAATKHNAEYVKKRDARQTKEP